MLLLIDVLKLPSVETICTTSRIASRLVCIKREGQSHRRI